jgi:hypothetical protein
MNDDKDERARADAFSAAIPGLMAFFLGHGCPCRFPRFRATCERDTAEVGVPGYTTSEQQSLVTSFDTVVPLVQKLRTRRGYAGKCAICGARVERWSEEHFRDVYFEYMSITRAKGIADVGEPLHAPVPRCWAFFGARPANRNEEQMLASSYPKIPVDDWFAWIRELRT